MIHRGSKAIVVLRTAGMVAAAALLALAAQTGRAVAQSGPPTASAVAQPGAAEASDKPADADAQPSIASSLGAFGDPGGARKKLADFGIAYSFTYIGEVLDNASGGMRTGAAYEGRLDLELDADLEKLAGLKGGALHASLFQIHGTGLSRYYVGNLLTTSGIEALPSTRLFELWYEQKFLDDKLAIRIGQLAADSEFLISQYGGLFVNSTFGWPGINGNDLPSGGPAYPLATPGIRVKYAPTDQLSIMAGLYNGDAAGPAGPYDNPDPQRRNRYGTDFRVRDPAFAIVEGAYAYNQGKDAVGLPGTVKLGAWHHFGRFDDVRYDGLGLSLADPLTSGVPARHRGDTGVYAMIDQMVYRMPGTTDQGIGVFARVSGAPSDRNLIDFYVDGGATWKGIIPGRGDDTFGVSLAYAKISDRVRDFDIDAIAFSGLAQPLRSSEAIVEATYQAQIVPGWTVQPDIQYIVHPGGNVVNPRYPQDGLMKDALVFGVRTTIHY